MTVDPQLYQQVQQELQQREKIVWLGQPLPGPFGRKSIKTLFFAIPWTAFALFWTAGVAGFEVPDFNESTDFFPLFGVPFVLIGVGLMARPISDYFKAYRLVYVITNERVITIEFGKKKKIFSVDRSEIESVTRVEKAGGSGDLSISLKGSIKRFGLKAMPQVKIAEAYLQPKRQEQ